MQFDNLVSNIQNMQSQLHFLKDKDGSVVILLGETGVGKTALSLYLSGSKLYCGKNGVLKDENGDIGQEKTSKTSIPKSYGYYIDTPGWLDTGNAGIDTAYNSQYTSELSNAAVVKALAISDHVKNFKFLILINYADFIAARWTKMQQLFKLLESQFICMHGDALESIGLIITKMDGKKEAHSTAKKLLTDIVAQEGNIFKESTKRFIKHIIDNEKFATFSKVDDCDGGVYEVKNQKEIIQNLVDFDNGKLPFIKNNKNIFSYAISADAVNHLKDVIINPYLDDKKKEFAISITTQKQNMLQSDDILNLKHNEISKIINMLYDTEKNSNSFYESFSSRTISDNIGELKEFSKKIQGIENSIKLLDLGDFFSNKIVAMQSLVKIFKESIIAACRSSVVMNELEDILRQELTTTGFKFEKQPGSERKNYVTEKFINLESSYYKLQTMKLLEQKEAFIQSMYPYISKLGIYQERKDFKLDCDIFKELNNEFLFNKLLTIATNVFDYDSNIIFSKVSTKCDIKAKFILSTDIQKTSFGCKSINVEADYIVLNSDLNLPGVNLNITANKEISIVKHLQGIAINLQGNHPKDIDQMLTTPDGKSDQPSLNGIDGKNGNDGGNLFGKIHNVMIHGDTNKKIIVDLSGGQGYNGQSTGKGGKASSGDNALPIEISYIDLMKKVSDYRDYVQKLKNNKITQKDLCEKIGIIPQVTNERKGDMNFKKTPVNDGFTWYAKNIYEFYNCGSAPLPQKKAGIPGKGGNCGKAGNMDIEFTDGVRRPDLFQKKAIECIKGTDGNKGEDGERGVYKGFLYQKIKVADESESYAVINYFFSPNKNPLQLLEDMNNDPPPHDEL